jgi:hypothetical protein
MKKAFKAIKTFFKMFSNKSRESCRVVVLIEHLNGAERSRVRLNKTMANDALTIDDDLCCFAPSVRPFRVELLLVY